MGRQFLILLFYKPGDRNYKLWNIVSTERYKLHMHICKNVAIYKWKVHSEADLAITMTSFISNSMATTF
jgi:hypothetical protein